MNEYDLDKVMEEIADSEPIEEKKKRRYSRKSDQEMLEALPPATFEEDTSSRLVHSREAEPDIRQTRISRLRDLERQKGEDILQTLSDREAAGMAMSEREEALHKKIKEDQYGRSAIGRVRGFASGAQKKWRSAGQYDREENLRAKDPMKYYLYKELQKAEKEGREPHQFAIDLAKERIKARATGPREQDYLASAANLRAQAALSRARLEQMQGGPAPARVASPVSISASPGATSYWNSLRLGPGQPAQPTIAHLQQRSYWDQLSGDSPTASTNYWASLNLGMGSSQQRPASNTPPASYWSQLGLGPSAAPQPPPRLQARAYRRTAPKYPPRRALKKWVKWKKNAPKKSWKKTPWKKTPWKKAPKKTWKKTPWKKTPWKKKTWKKWKRY